MSEMNRKNEYHRQLKRKLDNPNAPIVDLLLVKEFGIKKVEKKEEKKEDVKEKK